MKHNQYIPEKRTSIHYLIIAFVMLLCYNSNAQQQEPRTEVVSQVYSSMEMELVLWFMGTRKCKSAADFEDRNSSHKKEIIKSGMTPNRILTRAFMNKALNYESTIA